MTTSRFPVRGALALLLFAASHTRAATEGPVLWLDASHTESLVTDSNGRLQRWADRSKTGNDAQQLLADAQPQLVPGALGGRSVVRFDGNDFLDLGQPESLDFRPGDPFTVTVVYQAEEGAQGTFLAKGGGGAEQRSYQFYVTTKNQGAIAYGVMRENPRPSGPGIAMFTCDGKRADVFLNGQVTYSFDGGSGSSDVNVLVGSRRQNADNTGIFYPLNGDIAEILVYDRVLSPIERRQLGRHLEVKYCLEQVYTDPNDGKALIALLEEPGAINQLDRIATNVARLGTPADLEIESLLETRPELATVIAELTLKLSQNNQLSDSLAIVAGKLLEHRDPFVRGMCEWALAMKVGHENNGQEANWPRSDPAPWFESWIQLSPGRLLEADWVRQAVAAGIHRDAGRLLESIDTMLDRAERMARDFSSQLAQDSAATLLSEPLDAMRLIRDGLTPLKGASPDVTHRRQMAWLEIRRHLRALVMANPATQFEQVVFVKRFAPHTVRNITRSYAWKHKPGGDICVLSSWRSGGDAQGVLQGRLGPGYVWGLDLWWDADRVVFGFARQPNWPPHVNTADSVTEGRHVFDLRKQHTPIHLFEATFDDSEPTQLTNDDYWSDFEPTYCADGRIVFASDRCGRSAECGNDSYDHTNPNLFVVSADRSSVQKWTDSKDIDRYPHSLDDGRIAYTHWEYQERHFMEVHALWTGRPDGTMSDALFKHHLRAPCGLRDTRSIPRSTKVVSIATGHHTFAYGPIVVIDPSHGMNSPGAIAIVTPGVVPQEGPMAGSAVADGGVKDYGGLYQTPWALSENCFLASYSYGRPNCTAPAGVDSNGFALYLVDTYGNRELVHRDPLLSSVLPIPLRPRPRPPLLPDLRPPMQPFATCYIPDVQEGMSGVDPGTVRFIRISQHVAWPFDQQRGQMDYIPGNAGSKQVAFQSWSPVRVIGTVPVERDGSAYFKVPADTAIYFQALDENQLEIVRMRSMVSLKKGETRGCRGCHESQAAAPALHGSVSLAAQQPPRLPEPPSWGADRLLGYHWLVQPILDRHCVRCHGAEEAAGGLDFSATVKADGLLQSYQTMFGARQGESSPGTPLVACSDRFSNADITQPKQFGSHKSLLVQAIADDLHRQEVSLDPDERIRIVTWVDANAPYYDQFLNKRPDSGGKVRREVDSRPLAPMANATREPAD